MTSLFLLGARCGFKLLKVLNGNTLRFIEVVGSRVLGFFTDIFFLFCVSSAFVIRLNIFYLLMFICFVSLGFLSP